MLHITYAYSILLSSCGYAGVCDVTASVLAVTFSCVLLAELFDGVPEPLAGGVSERNALTIKGPIREPTVKPK